MELGTNCCDCCAIHRSIDWRVIDLTDARGDLNDEKEMGDCCDLKSTVNWLVESELVIAAEAKTFIKGDDKEGCVECLLLAVTNGSK